MGKQGINIVWFRRDLRLEDNLAVSHAIESGLPVLFVYNFEDETIERKEHDLRHFRFIFQSLLDINRKLSKHGHEVLIVKEDSDSLFLSLLEKFEIKTVFSHFELGLDFVRRRRKRLSGFFKEHNIKWVEFPSNGIKDLLPSREGWLAQWNDYVNQPIVTFPGFAFESVPVQGLSKNFGFVDKEFTGHAKQFQPGGEGRAKVVLQSFLRERGKFYLDSIPYPEKSRRGCSRLGPYLSYGCISLRQVYQAVSEAAKNPELAKNMNQYKLRLYWRSHYMQKLASEPEIEKRAINPALEDLDRGYDPELFNAWAKGETGFPMIDASIRCLEQTGYLNFRLRAMLVTFATYTLWQDWRPVADRLASLFLDYEPGIHYGQIQAQAGLSGYQTLRVFNPMAQSEKYDRYGNFLRKWLPELDPLPSGLIHRPWKLTPKEQEQYGVIVGKDYPKPVVDYDISTRIAKEHYWRLRARDEVTDYLETLWHKHVAPEKIPAYRRELNSPYMD